VNGRLPVLLRWLPAAGVDRGPRAGMDRAA
jgi:hypothetical protein